MKLKFDQMIYVITGPCGIGKSSISYSLADRYERSAHIDADYLYHMVVGGRVRPWEDDWALLNLLWANIRSVTENFVTRGITPVIDYVIFPEQLGFVKEIAEKHDLKVKYVVLMADEKTVRHRDNCRPSDIQMGERAVILLNEFQEKKMDDRFILDTTNRSIEETISEIIASDRFIIYNV
jgi:2-phosphoglycerate kinase